MVKNTETDAPIADSLLCNIPPEFLKKMLSMFQVSTFLFFVSPMSAITVFYILIGITLRNSGIRTHRSQASCNSTSGGGASAQAQSRQAVLKMLGK